MPAMAVREQLMDVEASAVAGERRPVGEEKTFRAYDPDQVLLISPVLREWVPEGDLAHFVSDLVESALDLSPIYASYEAERVDAEEDEHFGPDRRGDELPEELRRREGRLERIREAKAALEAEAAECERARRAEMQAQGKKPRNRRMGVTRSRRSQRRSATSPIRSRRS
jgi:hypothetical protein